MFKLNQRFLSSVIIISLFFFIKCLTGFPNINKINSNEVIINDILNDPSKIVELSADIKKLNVIDVPHKDETFQINLPLNEIRDFQSNLMKSYMNVTIDPCDDFYTYACGNWENLHPIPKDNSEYNVFSLLNMNILESLKELLSEPFEQQFGIELNAEDKSKLFFTSCTNMKAISQRGTEPLLNFIDSLGGWPVLDDNWNEENFDLIEICAKATRMGLNNFLNLAVEIDLKNTKKYALYLEEVILGLENRDDFLIDENSVHLTAYKNLIITILTLLDVDHDKAEDAANEIIKFEINLANITADNRVNIAVHDHYVGTTLGEIAEKYPELNVTRFINLVFDKEFDSDLYVVLFSSPHFGEMIEFLSKTDKRILANYIAWRNVQMTFRRLDERFLAAAQTFDEALTGQKELEPQWKKCVQYINEKMGMAVGAQFVRVHFDENSKKDVEKLTKEIQNMFKQRLMNIDWIDDETKSKSNDKVNIIQLAVGYPDFILSINELNKFYSDIHIQKDKHFENALNLGKYEQMENLKNLGKEVDKSQWPANPAVVNAFFEPTKNRIIVPAGVLQPPIYHRSLPKALNYGGIGVFVGHELTHGFDDTGREFDADGNLIRWWSNDSIKHFQEKTKCFIDQYSSYSIHGKFLSGEASKSENIADNGGIRQSFKAYKKWMETASSEDLENEKLPNLNLTHEQLYFLSFAQAWCGQIRPEAIENLIETDAHCPGQFRVKGSLANFEEFGKAFQCPSGSPMNPDKKCILW